MSSRKGKKKQMLFLILLVICIIGFLIAAASLIRSWYVKKQAADLMEELANQTQVVTEEPSEEVDETETEEESTETDILAELGIEVPEKNLDFDALHEQNADIYAWIYIPEIGIDYPVLQHPTDDSYYLEHNLDGSSGYPGCIYTEAINSKEFTDPNTVLYGHNMKDGSMFGALHKLEDRDVFESTPYIFIYTPEQTYVYRIFAAYEFSAIHLLHNFDLDNEEIFQNYLDQIFETREMSANISQDIEVNAENHIITLSTCVSGEKNKRFLVQGVLVNDMEQE